MPTKINMRIPNKNIRPPKYRVVKMGFGIDPLSFIMPVAIIAFFVLVIIKWIYFSR
jgi:hypothetical protein